MDIDAEQGVVDRITGWWDDNCDYIIGGLFIGGAMVGTAWLAYYVGYEKGSANMYHAIEKVGGDIFKLTA